MRYLGADPATPADDVERLLMEKLNNRVVTELNRRAKNG